MRAIARPTATATVKYARPRAAIQNARGAMRRSAMALFVSSRRWPVQLVPMAPCSSRAVKDYTLRIPLGFPKAFFKDLMEFLKDVLRNFVHNALNISLKIH